MNFFFTPKRILGLLLAMAGLSAIVVGLHSGRQEFLFLGGAAWIILLLGLLLGVMQRAGMLMKMISAVRSDLDRISTSQQSIVSEVSRHLKNSGMEQKRAISAGQDQVLRLRRELRRGFDALEATLSRIAGEQVDLAKVQSAQHVSAISAIVSIESKYRDLVQMLADLSERTEAASVALVKRHEMERHEIHRALSDSSTLSLRVYRDLRADLESRQDQFDSTSSELLNQIRLLAEEKRTFHASVESRWGHLDSTVSELLNQIGLLDEWGRSLRAEMESRWVHSDTISNRLLDKVIAIESGSHDILDGIASRRDDLDARLDEVLRRINDSADENRRLHGDIESRWSLVSESLGKMAPDSKSLLNGFGEVAAGMSRVLALVAENSRESKEKDALLGTLAKSGENQAIQLEDIKSEINIAKSSIDDLRICYEDDKKQLRLLSRNEKVLRSISRRALQWLKYETVREVEAVLQLRQAMDVNHFTPLLGGWAMDPESVLALVKLLMERKPDIVVELGSGASSIWIAMTLRRIGHGKLISYDHLPEYAGHASQAIAEAGLHDWAEIRVAPLSPVEFGDEKFDWYRINNPDADGPIDVMLVDGPPGSTGSLARYPALPRFHGAMADGALIVVDDATRGDEEKMVARWREEFPALEVLPGLGPRTSVLRLASTTGHQRQGGPAT